MRMQALALICVAVCAAPCAAASNAMWTWVSGPNSPGQYGVYGTKGLADAGNVPGSRGYAISWIGSSDNLWLFGGYGNAASGGEGVLNDLWQFDGTNWIWVSGSNSCNQYGVYGTKGVAAPSNVPGARQESVSWIDGGGNLRLFGGLGLAASGYASYLNDLWRFDGTDWTWVGGSSSTSQYGVYGTKGVAATGNMPGSRYGSISWMDSSGNLLLFGGSGYATGATSAGHLNDLWKFDGTNWTWVSGSNTTRQYGVYGTKGVAASSNVPGARHDAISWRDASGNLWLFGGNGYAASDYAFLNDLWKFNGTNWTWVSGSNSTDQPGVYGTKGVAAPSNTPGARAGSVSWVDGDGNLWLFGGMAVGYDDINDLWKFNGTNWTWVSGSNSTGQSGVYGTIGEAGLANVPGARHGCVSWIDGRGNLWLFGGYGYAAGESFGTLNDLWRFGIPEDTEDFTGDGGVDGADLAILVSQWLTNPTGMPSADISPQPAGDNIVNFRDFAVLAGRWLEAAGGS